MGIQFEIVTIFPGFFAGFLENGILRRAQADGLVTVGVHDLRAFTHDRHRTVDDRPFGGGEGMVLKPEPIARALASMGIAAKAERALSSPTHSAEDAEWMGHGEKMGITAKAERALSSPTHSAEDAEWTGHGTSLGSPQNTAGSTRVILLSAQGRPFTQAVARDLAGQGRVVLLCGRYEGVDERINELYCDMELSIGDYVLSGGELAAAVVVDATMRLIPGVLGNEASSEFESFGVADDLIKTDEEGVPRSQHGAGGLLDYPHYTRPAEFGGLRAPDVLMNGDHLQIRRWRREQQLRKTMANRPDLLDRASLSEEDRKLLNTIRGHNG